jgi:hypothetical protein
MKEYKTIVSEIADDILDSSWDTKDELIRIVVRIVTQYRTVIENQRQTVKQNNTELLPETELMAWMLIAAVISDIIDRLATETEYTYTELVTELPDKYVEFIT